jgi:hypothetical protein
MTLTDFLLARIAEDEEAARQWEDEHSGLFPSLVYPERVLAECEAKRRLVRTHETHCVGYHDWPLVGVHLERADRAGVDVGLWHALRLVALPYADHPDYDEAWRP